MWRAWAAVSISDELESICWVIHSAHNNTAKVLYNAAHVWFMAIYIIYIAMHSATGSTAHLYYDGCGSA